MELTIGPLTIRYYAITMLIGIFVAFWVAMRRRDKFNILRDDIENLVILGLPVGILSARLYHLISEYRYYAENPSEIFSLQFNGLSFFGAFIGIVILGFVYTRVKKISLIDLLDLAAPTILLAQAIGRLGNYFNHELYGFPTSLPWGIHIPEPYRIAGYEVYERFHPAFAYELILNLAGFAVIMIIEKRLKATKHYFQGLNISLYMIWYGIVRFAVGFVRIEPDDWWILNDGQIFAIGFIIVGIVLGIYSYQKNVTK